MYVPGAFGNLGLRLKPQNQELTDRAFVPSQGDMGTPTGFPYDELHDIYIDT